MAIRKVDALVLRRLKFRETSLLVTFFSADSGKFTGLLKGARDPRRPRYGSPAELFSMNHVVYYEKRHGEIHTVAQCDLIESFRSIRADLVKTTCASYLVDVLGLLTESRDPNPPLFEMGVEGIRRLAAEHDADRVLVITVLRLLALSGVSPSPALCVMCGATPAGAARFSVRVGGALCAACGTRQSDAVAVSAGALASLAHVSEAEGEQLWRLRFPAAVLRELLPLTKALLSHHVGQEPRSQQILEQIVRETCTFRNSSLPSMPIGQIAVAS